MSQGPRSSDDIGSDERGNGSVSDSIQDETEDRLTLSQSGLIGHYTSDGIVIDEEDMADIEGDDQLDDDMMDKISSSPSIDDGR